MIIDRKNKEKKKEKKEDENDDNKGKIRKDSKKKIEIPRGGVTQPTNHTREEINRPPSQIKNNSYSVIRTCDLDDLSCTRCTYEFGDLPQLFHFVSYRCSICL